MKLSQKQIRKLESILDSVTRANNKLFSAKRAYCIRTDSPNNGDYVNNKGQGLIDVEKNFGTEICYYKDVEKMLRSFIENQGQDVKVLIEV